MRLPCFAVLTVALAQIACAGEPVPMWLEAPMTRDGIHLSLSAGGSRTHVAVQVDTGSTGIAIRRSIIGRSTAVPADEAPPPFIAYNSSGRAMCGTWVYTDITLTGRNGKSVTIPNMPVLGIDYVCHFPPGPVPDKPCNCARTRLPRGTGPAMMGVGFDRGPGMAGPKQNPFLQLPQMNVASNPMPRAYIITTAGVQLGVTPSDLATFQLVPLRKAPAQNPVYGWRQARGCVSIAGGGVTGPNRACGDVLMDTGVDRMYLSYENTAPSFDPPLQTGMVWRCCGQGRDIAPCVPGQPACMVNGGGTASVTVTWSDATPPIFSYTATAPQQFDARGTSPIFASVWNGAVYDDPTQSVFVNTSRQLLNDADYLYDATHGNVGFRKKK
jgi:hypothetical protein